MGNLRGKLYSLFFTLLLPLKATEELKILSFTNFITIKWLL